MHKVFYFSTTSKYESIDVTHNVQIAVKESKIKEGLVSVFVSHATCGIIVNENADPNIQLDFLDAMQELIKDGKWRHDKIDGNAAAHIKASLVGPSVVVPVVDGKLAL